MASCLQGLLLPSPACSLSVMREELSSMKRGTRGHYRVVAGTQARHGFYPVSKPSVTAVVSRAMGFWSQRMGQSCNTWLSVQPPLSLSLSSDSGLSPLSVVHPVLVTRLAWFPTSPIFPLADQLALLEKLPSSPLSQHCLWWETGGPGTRFWRFS